MHPRAPTGANPDPAAARRTDEQRHKQKLSRSRKEENRHKDNTDAKGRNEGRHGYLRSPSQDAVIHRTALGHIAMKILDLDSRIIDQNADRKCHSAQCHDIDGLTQNAQDHNGTKDGKRYGNADNKGTPPATKKQEDHQCSQKRGDNGLPDDILNRDADKN